MDNPSQSSNGKRADDFLREIEERPEVTLVMNYCNRKPHLDAVSSMAKSVRQLVNGDVCISERQAISLASRMSRKAEEHMAEIPKKKDSKDMANDMPMIIELATMINTMRLECEICLNKKCTVRKSE